MSESDNFVLELLDSIFEITVQILIFFPFFHSPHGSHGSASTEFYELEHPKYKQIQVSSRVNMYVIMFQ